MSAHRKPQDLPPPILVDDSEGMDRLLADLGSQAEIAVDTEADSFFHYRERVCLIQVTVEDRDYLVDPLSDVPLDGIGDMLADEDRVKVFHDGEYDILILKRDYGFEFRNLFDTRVAAAALGMATPGLAAVIGDRFGVELDKSLQRSNWSTRPLSAKQIAYARLDTHYLIPLMHEMREELDERGRTIIVDGECRRLEALAPQERVFEPDEFLRIKGARTLSPMHMQVLRELHILRDGLARERDLPPFKVLGNHVLIALAKSQPSSQRQLGRVEELSPRVARRIGSDLLGAIERAKEMGPMKRVPQLPSRDGTGELSEESYELHERLKTWRKTRAQAEGYDASLILNRHVLLRLAAARPGSAADLEEVEGLQDWQRELFGEEILATCDAFEDDLEAGRIELRRRRRSKRRRGSDS
ncbi:MAG: HRDC domain-containing protein [Planctomycetota bacterium]